MPYCMQFAVVFPTMKAQLDAQEHAPVNNSVAAVMYALSPALPGYKTPPCTLNPWLRAFSTSCPSFHRTVLKTCSSRDAEARSMSSSEELTPRQRRLLKQKRKWEQEAAPKPKAEQQAASSTHNRQAGEAGESARSEDQGASTRRASNSQASTSSSQATGVQHDQPHTGRRGSSGSSAGSNSRSMEALPSPKQGIHHASNSVKLPLVGAASKLPNLHSLTASYTAAQSHAAMHSDDEQRSAWDPAVDALVPLLEQRELTAAKIEQLSTAQLVALATAWADKLATMHDDLQRATSSASQAAASEASSHVLSISNAHTLAAAAEARLAGEGLGRQELATMAWFVAHFDREWASRSFEPAMQVPFRVIPQTLSEVKLEDFMSEVALNRDTIQLDAGDGSTKLVPEARLTGWQSDIGATFRYSGKEMVPQAGGITPHIAKVRDMLHQLTGQWFDSVLINYYEDGKCGMRFHVDPLYGVWATPTAVVSLGHTRTFIFREISDYNIRWQYSVRNGDVVYMFDDCQDRLQHCIKVERRAEDAGPRMSLVFKQRLPGTVPAAH